MLKNIRITPKMLLLTVVVGVATWVLLDFYQTRAVKGLFYGQLNERLESQAGIDRQVFDRYVSSYTGLVKIIGAEHRFYEYVNEAEKRAWSREEGSGVHFYRGDLPPWFPTSSVLRPFAQIRFAFLLDGENRVRECYYSTLEPPPEFLLHPGDILSQLSHNEFFFTEIGGKPYILASHFVMDEQAVVKATLLLASPLDSSLLMNAMGVFHVNNLVALVDRKAIILASSRPDIIGEGKPVSAVEDEYLMTGKSFFDYGVSNLEIQFASFLAKSEYITLSSEILRKERTYRAITALALTAVFMAIIILITRGIGKVTDQIMSVSTDVLGLTVNSNQSGDEIDILESSFQNFTREILSSRELLLQEKQYLEDAQDELKMMNIEIERNRKNLQDALDEVSTLIMSAATEKNFSVRFENPKFTPCNEILRCEKKDCPCYGRSDIRCWQQHSNVFCRDMSEAFQGMHGNCLDCQVYKSATEDPIYLIGEQFNNMMHILELKNNELEKAYKELKSTQAQMLQQEKMASIGVLSAGVAHEINNPVGFIASNITTFGRYIKRLKEYIDLLQNNAEEFIHNDDAIGAIRKKKRELKIDFLLEDAEDLVGESLEGTDRVKAIVNNLKSFSRLDEVEYKEADINQCLESTLNIVWNELKYKATVEKDYGTLPETKCFPQQLNQVFMNLLINAVHAIDEKGFIRIRTRHDGGFIFVDIEDTGRGIAPENITRIFEPFFTTKEVGKGTGLGLSITYDIVKKHNGDISVVSEVGKGAVFTVKIPVVL